MGQITRLRRCNDSLRGFAQDVEKHTTANQLKKSL